MRSPDGTTYRAAGSLYLRSDGAPGATLYVKETTAGWVAK